MRLRAKSARPSRSPARLCVGGPLFAPTLHEQEVVVVPPLPPSAEPGLPPSPPPKGLPESGPPSGLLPPLQVWVVVSHVPPLGQSLFVAHFTQPREGTQAGPFELPVQSAFVAQAPHVSVVELQTGLGSMQSAELAHCTHLPLFGSPVPVAHTGFGIPAQSAFDVHARQECDVMSQIGVPPAQSLFERQPTQVSLVVSHLGVGAVQAVIIVASHCTHWP